MSTTIRVDVATRDRIAALARSTGQPMTAVIDEAMDALERRRFFEQFNNRYAELRRDDDVWAEIEAERAAEAGGLRDSSA